jgi:hypothetical protein
MDKKATDLVRNQLERAVAAASDAVLRNEIVIPTAALKIR